MIKLKELSKLKKSNQYDFIPFNKKQWAKPETLCFSSYAEKVGSFVWLEIIVNL